VQLLYRSPVDLYVDQWVYELLAAIECTGARRVLIDSLGDLAFAAGEEARYREYLYSLVQRCSRPSGAR
jgi:circadian clock protein KaiC